jgi:hypothetical protein
MAKKIYAGATLWLALAGSAPGEKVVYATWEQGPIARNLRKAVRNNGARDKILHDLFEQVGCTGDSLAEQKIRGTKVATASSTTGAAPRCCRRSIAA